MLPFIQCSPGNASFERRQKGIFKSHNKRSERDSPRRLPLRYYNHFALRLGDEEFSHKNLTQLFLKSSTQLLFRKLTCGTVNCLCFLYPVYSVPCFLLQICSHLNHLVKTGRRSLMFHIMLILPVHIEISMSKEEVINLIMLTGFFSELGNIQLILVQIFLMTPCFSSLGVVHHCHLPTTFSGSIVKRCCASFRCEDTDFETKDLRDIIVLAYFDPLLS